jgi:hypothetical protein
MAANSVDYNGYRLVHREVEFQFLTEADFLLFFVIFMEISG